MDISTRVAVLDFGKKLAEGSPQAIRADPDVIKAYLGEETATIRKAEEEVDLEPV
jgi:branched-chain amino acid transport system ATP-binding protein